MRLIGGGGGLSASVIETTARRRSVLHRVRVTSDCVCVVRQPTHRAMRTYYSCCDRQPIIRCYSFEIQIESEDDRW
jgi:hypothetical protein